QGHSVRAAEEPMEPHAAGAREALGGPAYEQAPLPRVPAEGDARGRPRPPPGERRADEAIRMDRVGVALSTDAVQEGRADDPGARRRDSRVRRDGLVERPLRGHQRKGPHDHASLLWPPRRVEPDRADLPLLLGPRSSVALAVP